MKVVDLKKASVSQLVQLFTDITLKQYNAQLYDEIALYNKLFDEMCSVSDELKSRPDDQRAALVPLFSHPNPQARLMAAEMTLAVVPQAARRALQELWDQQEFPQAAYALGTLRALDRGERKPT
jgi:hypothetical protein